MHSAADARPRVTPLQVAIALLGALALAVGVGAHPLLGAGVLAIGLGVLLRPLQVMPALVAAASAATFVNNEGGSLTRDLSIVVVLLAYAGLGLLLAFRHGRWSFPASGFSLALGACLASTALSGLHGVLAGAPPKFIALEFLPMGALAVAWMAGGLRLGDAQLRNATRVLIAVGLMHVALGLYSYVENKIRAGGVYFTPVPGLLALLLIHRLFHEDRPLRWRLLDVLFIGAFLLHQALSFTRGYWLGFLAALPLAVGLYVGRGPGAPARLVRALGLLGGLAAVAAVALVAASAFYGWDDVLALIAERFASSVGLRPSSQTASNIARLAEFSVGFREIAAAPWFGHGLGHVVHVRSPIYNVTTSQWYIHQQYILTTLKQGAVGLALFLFVLGMAVRMGARGALRGTGPTATWSAAAATATIHTAVVGLAHFPFAVMNVVVLLALFWGVALSRSGAAPLRVTWRRSPAARGAGGAP